MSLQHAAGSSMASGQRPDSPSSGGGPLHNNSNNAPAAAPPSGAAAGGRGTSNDNSASTADATAEGQATGSHRCQECGREFATRRNLTRHAANHNDTKPYICTHLGCGRSFARSDLLLRHSRLHSRPGGLNISQGASSRAPSEGVSSDMDTGTGEGAQDQPFVFNPPPASMSLPPLPSIASSVHHPLPAPLPAPPVYPFNEQFNQFVNNSGVWGSGIGASDGLDFGGAGRGAMSMDLGYGAGEGMPFPLPPSNGFGAPGAGPGGPGWEAWDSSLAWLVEGAISRAGSPVQGAPVASNAAPPLFPPSAADPLPRSVNSDPTITRRVPPEPLDSFYDPPRPYAPPDASTRPLHDSPVSQHSPPLSTHSHSHTHNLNTLASAAAAAVGASPVSTSTPASNHGGEVIKQEESVLKDERDARWPQHFDPAASETRSPVQPSPSVQRGVKGGRAGEASSPDEGQLPDLDRPMPGSEKWKHLWMDEATLSRVGNVCDLARFMPGSVDRVFELPRSLHTVNHLLSAYYTHVLPLLPIVHLPTFNPQHAAPLVLAAMMCIGSCFSPLPGAAKFGIDIAEQTRRAMAALYEHDLTNLRSEHIMHASLLTCVAGLWSGNKRAFELAEIARGQLVNLCRRGRLFDRPSVGQRDGLGWNAWAAGESRKRLGACIMLLDGFFPSLLQTPSYISQGELSNMVFPCDDRYWEAPTANQWQSMLGMAPIPPSPFFAPCISAILTPRYVLNAQPPDPHLNGFGSLIIMTALHHHTFELRQHLYTYMAAGISVPMYAGAPDFREGTNQPKPVNMALGFEGRKQWLTDALALWEKYYTRNVEGPFALWGQSLLRLGTLSLTVDVQDLNDAAGQHGSRAASLALGRLRSWAQTDDAVASSAAAVRLLSTLASHSSHVGPYGPLCCFAATLTIWGRLSLGASNGSWDPALASKLINMIGGLPLSSEEAPQAVRRYGAGLLKQMKAWRVAESLESILLRVT